MSEPTKKKTMNLPSLNAGEIKVLINYNQDKAIADRESANSMDELQAVVDTFKRAERFESVLEHRFAAGVSV